LRRSRPNRKECLTLWPKILPGSFSEIDENVGPVSTWGRKLLRGWWRPISLMVSFMIFTASVRNIVNTT
jgi:hypothetical protein